MAAENKTSRWNRFEIAFNEEKRPEAAACKKDWRNKWEKTGGTGGLEGRRRPPFAQEALAVGVANRAFEASASAEASSAQEMLVERTLGKSGAAQGAFEEPLFEQEISASSEPAFAQEAFVGAAGNRAFDDLANAEASSARETFVKSEAFKKNFSSGAVRNLEEARRVKIDAEGKKRVKSALKLKRILELPPEESDFPIARRLRTRRMSAPPRRFDDRRRDWEDGRN